MAPNTESFQAILLRERMVDADGNPINVDLKDPDAWALAEALADSLSDAGAPLDVQVLGRYRVTVVSTDDSELASLCCLEEHMAGKTFIRAHLVMGRPDGTAPAMGNLIAISVATDTWLVYQIVVCADDLPPLEPGALAIVSLPPGEAVLELRADLGLITAGIEEEGASHAA